MNARIVFVFGFVFCITALLYEKMQFASWGRLTQLSRQLKTRVRTKLRGQNFLRSIQHGRHRFSSFLTHFINQYRVQHIAPVAAPTAIKPIALLSPGSLVFTRHKVIQDIEQRMYQRIKELLKLSDNEYEAMLEEIQKIREKRMEELVDSTGRNFSHTHEQLPQDIKKIFYQLCAEYSIIPENIIIRIENNMKATASVQQIEVESRPVVELSISVTLLLKKNHAAIRAVLAHELGHIIQADYEVQRFIVNLMTIHWKKHNYSEYMRPIYHEAVAVFVNNVEKIADILFASRSIQHAHAMGHFRNITDQTWQKNILHEAFEPLMSPKRPELGYPFFSESVCSFINNTEKIWGKKWQKLD